MTIKTAFNQYKRKTQGNTLKFNTLITVSLGESTTVIWLHGHAVKLFCKSLHYMNGFMLLIVSVGKLLL